MQLHEWQQCFQHVVLGEAAADTLLLSEKGLTRELSMGIYANAYRERLHDALRENYSALHNLLGDDDFAAMAYAFTATHPPREASIRWFGAALPEYLRITEPYSGIPAIGELAQFEWALRHTVDAGDGERIDAEFLQSLPPKQWENLRCDLHPSLTILSLDWNAPQVWRALDADEEPPPPTLHANHWLVYRGTDLMSEWRSADAQEVEAIQCWRRGENFGALCQMLAERIDDAEAAVTTAASYMHTWVEQGLLIFPSKEN